MHRDRGSGEFAPSRRLSRRPWRASRDKTRCGARVRALVECLRLTLVLKALIDFRLIARRQPPRYRASSTLSFGGPCGLLPAFGARPWCPRARAAASQRVAGELHSLAQRLSSRESAARLSPSPARFPRPRCWPRPARRLSELTCYSGPSCRRAAPCLLPPLFASWSLTARMTC